MSTNRDVVSHNSKTCGIGVTGMAPPKENYNPSKHNPSRPLRLGAEDFINCPSLDHTGIRKAYWALRE